MEIKDLFYRPIDRIYESVVKADTSDEETLKQELDEYVVTDELEKYFGRFFRAYTDSLDNPTTDTGVWISGYFGSGKSHFLKMLAFLLENKEVDGKHAIDYFDADRKIRNPAIIKAMHRAESVPTDVILFNIDAKAASGSENTILGVFNRLFNEMQGFYGANPVLADMERFLASKGRYEEFKQKYEDLSGGDWTSDRNDFDFTQEDVKQTLLDMGIWEDEKTADSWCEKATMPDSYTLSIEDFSKRVKKYLDHQGKDHRIVFLLDEVGQYVTQREDRMLNLQTMTEKLGTICQGRAWVVVTSQQNIEEIRDMDKFMNYDFSKIQSRFHTRISLSSAEADTIIKKRILEKKNEVRPLLEGLYENNETVIHNLLQFSAGPEHKLYTDASDFADVYPIVTYQFKLIAASLDSIRKAGGSGKDAASTERTLLDLCKQAGMRTMHGELGKLVPLHIFYDALEDRLEHSVRIVITHALQNDNINPDHEENNFTVNVLKTLFLIKNVQVMKGSIENITTLMIDDIHADREVVQQQVKQSLRILDKEMLIQQDGDNFTFLTDEEQRTNRLIAATDVPRSDRFKEIGQIIFDDIYKDTKYRYPYLGNRYNFPFSVHFNEQDIRPGSQAKIGIVVLASGSEFIDSPEMIRTKSMGEPNSLIIALPSGYDEYITEVIKALQIHVFFNTHTDADIPNYSTISAAKYKEAAERKARATAELKDALEEAHFYVCGNELTLRSKDAVSRINEGMGSLISRVYNKLSYIVTPMNENDVPKALSTAENEGGTLISAEDEANPNAQDEVLKFIGTFNLQHKTVTRKAVEDRFNDIPYGYNAVDVEWILARLFRRELINLYSQDVHITSGNTKSGEILNMITKKPYLEKLTMDKRERVPVNQIQSMRNVLSDVLDYSISQNDEDSLVAAFRKKAGDLLVQLDGWKTLCKDGGYPGLTVIKDGIQLFNHIANETTTKGVFRAVFENEEDLDDFGEDIRDISAFFKSAYQRKFFDDGKTAYKRYDENKPYIFDTVLIQKAEEIGAILEKQSPYGDINRLGDLVQEFNEGYDRILATEKEPVLKAIDEAESVVLQALDNKPYKNLHIGEVQTSFKNLRLQMDKYEDIGQVKGLKTQAAENCQHLMDQFSSWQAKWDEAHKSPTPPKPPVRKNGETPVVEPPKPPVIQIQPKYRRMRDVLPYFSREISSEADIDSLVEEIRKKLQEELKEYKKINIQF